MALPAPTGWRLWLGVAAMTLGLALAAQQLIPMLYKPASSTPDAQPLQSADPAIRLTEVGGGVLTIYVDVTGAKDAADNFDKAGSIVSAVGQALQHGVSDRLQGVRTVRFSIRCQAINRFGQDVMAQLVTLETPLPALKGVDYAKARPADVLGLAQTVMLGAPGAYDAIAAWCADPARSGKAFCGKANSSSP
ncbi:MAG TPA: hypothetical protein VGM25_17560 [Caulobacteraceae bacterium]|jgi:hypothetical protein